MLELAQMRFKKMFKGFPSNLKKTVHFIEDNINSLFLSYSIKNIGVIIDIRN